MKLDEDQWLIDQFTFTYKGKKCDVYFVDAYESGELWRDVFVDLDDEHVYWAAGVPDNLVEAVFDLRYAPEYTTSEIEQVVSKALDHAKEI